MDLSSRNQGVRVQTRRSVDYHMLTSVEDVNNPPISTGGANFPV